MNIPDTFFTESHRTIAEMGLEKYVLEIELNGFTIVPPEVTGVTEDKVDYLVDVILQKCEELIGCKFDVAQGPEYPLDFDDYGGTLERLSRVQPSQFQLVEICNYDRAFRDLAVNPVASCLIRHILGPMTRFSSHNCFVKWVGAGYGDSLGLHCDQPFWGTSSQRKLQLGTYRLHQRERCLCLRTRFTSAQCATCDAKGCRGGNST